MNVLGKYLVTSLILLCYCILISGCKDKEELGLEVQPESDQFAVRQTDTATLFTTTVREDSLFSNALLYQLLGSYTDPVFGRSDAAIFTQVSIGTSAVLGTSAETLVPDSLVLALGYANYYGDTTTTQIVHVYRLTQDMSSDSLHYTNDVFSYDANDLASSFAFQPAPKSNLTVSSSAESPQLRIPLSLSLATELLSLNGQAAFASNTAWLQYFKGLYIKTDPVFGSGQGAISYFDFYNSPYSRLTLYYRKITSIDTTSTHFDFNLSNGVKISQQLHDYSGSTVGNSLLASSPDDSLNYIQAMAGVKTKITLPYLKHFTDSGSIVINKAELKITVQPGSTDVYAPPSRILLAVIDSATGASTYPVDYFEGLFYYGGTYSSAARTYTFNIGRQLQRIVDGRSANSGFYLIAWGDEYRPAVVRANRVVIGSGKNSTYPMRLNLFYTKLH